MLIARATNGLAGFFMMVALGCALLLLNPRSASLPRVSLAIVLAGSIVMVTWRWANSLNCREPSDRIRFCPSCAYEVDGRGSKLCPECGSNVRKHRLIAERDANSHSKHRKALRLGISQGPLIGIALLLVFLVGISASTGFSQRSSFSWFLRTSTNVVFLALFGMSFLRFGAYVIRGWRTSISRACRLPFGTRMRLLLQ